MPNGKNAVVLVALSFLLAVAVCSSYILVAFAVPNTHYSNPVCRYTNKDKTTEECCYTETTTYDNGKTVSQDWCYGCVKTLTGNWVCGTRYPARTSVGTINPLPPAGPAQPPSTPPPSSNETHVNNLPGNIGTVQSPSTPPPSLNAIPPPSALPSPTKQQTLTTTCPDGSTPDANGNCPPTPTTTTNQQSGLTSNNNPQQGHNHKGSNQPTQTGGGGQELTATKKHKGSKTDQGTTQPSS